MLTNSSKLDAIATAESSTAVSLFNVARYYNPVEFPHQVTALDWLQNQLATILILEFFQRWQNTFGRRFPELMEGDRGEIVVELQQHLNRWGANLVTDGVFGRRTRAAVIAFQQRRGLAVDGIVGVKTWAELVKPSQTVRLSQMLRIYSPSLYPQHSQALEWLQKQIWDVVLTEFAKRWRKQVL